MGATDMAISPAGTVKVKRRLATVLRQRRRIQSPVRECPIDAAIGRAQ
jgi:hypothetical protein